MKLFEYQAKTIFAEAGIPVPVFSVIENIDGLDKALEVSGLPCAVKAQVLSGGRGKAGLIKIAKTAEEARSAVKELFALPGTAAGASKDRGSPPVKVLRILIGKDVDIQKEIYLSVTAEPVSGRAVIMGCAEGGVDIEELSVKSPEKIIREYVDLNTGLQPFQINDFIWRMGLRGDTFKNTGKVVAALYNVFVKYDAELAEINPLFVTPDGVCAGDGKMIIDDNSMFRQTAFELTRDRFDSDMEFEAALEGIPYLQFDGNISLMCAGAGLTNTVFDLINYEGGSVANYLEFGGPNYRKAGRAMELCLRNKSKVILIVTFGTIARADVMAEDIVKAIEEFKPDRPIIACIRGTGEEEAMAALKKAGLDYLTDTEEAVRKAVAIAGAK
ncbi:MAG: acetate--CoA ligase family protein [Treponema sp.]|nr:acetate--CoA ligase family protein [Treponema sp.]